MPAVCIRRSIALQRRSSLVKSFFLIPSLLFLCSCSADNGGAAHAQDSAFNVVDSTAPAAAVPDTGLAPIPGYRFRVVGDFDGDGRSDTLTERFVSRLDGKEADKYYTTNNYDTVVTLTMAKHPWSFMVSSNPDIDTLEIARHTQLFGVGFIKNEGDLDGNGTDEISFIAEWADWSSINTCRVVSWGQGEWRELLSFGIHDWQLPSLPQTGMTYGMFGVDGMRVYSKEDSLNAALEKELLSFGLIEKVEDGVVRVQTYAEEDSDSIAIGESMVRTARLTPLSSAKPVVQWSQEEE